MTEAELGWQWGGNDTTKVPVNAQWQYSRPLTDGTRRYVACRRGPDAIAASGGIPRYDIRDERYHLYGSHRRIFLWVGQDILGLMCAIDHYGLRLADPEG